MIPEGGAVKTEKQFAGKQTAFFIKRVLLSKLRHPFNEKTRLLVLPGFSVFSGEGGIINWHFSIFNYLPIWLLTFQFI